MLNAEANVEVDITAADALEELREELERRGIVFAIARMKEELREELAGPRLLGQIGGGEDLRDPADGGRGVPAVGGGASQLTPRARFVSVAQREKPHETADESVAA